MAFTYDGTTVRGYIGGTFSNSLSAGGSAGSSDTTQPFRIGAYAQNPGSAGTNSFFNGYIDEVRVYNRALSDTEVANLLGTPGSACTSGGRRGQTILGRNGTPEGMPGQLWSLNIDTPNAAPNNGGYCGLL